MKTLILLVSVFVSGYCFAQQGPRTWKDHAGINSCNTVAKLGSKIYASNFNGLVWFDEQEINPQRLTKINGLHDINVKLLRTNKYNNKMLVIYENANIDVIDEAGNISNYSDIKLKPLSGKKYINEITFYKQFAYLACGFGIILFDTEKLEVKDTYIIGPGATNIEVFQVALNDSLIFAATESGLFVSNHKTRVLNNFNNWKKETKVLPAGPYCGVTSLNDKILACYAPSRLDNFNKGKDTLYILSNNTWQNYHNDLGRGTTIYKLGHTYKDLFSMIDLYGLAVRDINTGDLVNTCFTYNDKIHPVEISDVYFDTDYTSNIFYWIADIKYGLYHNYLYYTPHEKINLNGMNRRTVGNIDVLNGSIAVSPSYLDITGVGAFSREGINLLKNGEWSYIPALDKDGKQIIDINSVLFDRKDKTRMWAAAWKYGIIEYRNNQIYSVKTQSNTPAMPSVLKGEPRCSGLSQDKDGNLWFTHSDHINYLGVIKRNGEYVNFRFDAQRFARKTYVDKNNVVWILHEGNSGITVFKHDNFKVPVQNVTFKVLTKDVGKGNLQANSVTSWAEDHDGKIWIGTSEGISVFYNPLAIFGSGDFDAQPIKIVQDGNVELLLGYEKVMCIAVDGANNKWVGTVTGGVYCFSPDGQVQLYHFTAENSPLYSNTVIDINYDEATGDIFIGTDIGLQSFRSTIIAGAEQYNNVFAFPNPVRPNYQGTVLVKGLVDKSIVKITDESGTMVWETKSTGGQVEWPVATLAGKRVSSGVYIVYASTTNGELKAVTKILIVN